MYIIFGSFNVFESGNTKVPPARNEPKISYTDRSKERFARPKNTSFSLILYFLLTSIIVLIAALCVITTPFGSPVVPDVKII